MTEFQSNGKHYLAVTVPKDIEDAHINKKQNALMYFDYADSEWHSVFLPTKQARDIIGLLDPEFLDSIRSLNMNPETTLIIEKR